MSNPKGWVAYRGIPGLNSRSGVNQITATILIAVHNAATRKTNKKNNASRVAWQAKENSYEKDKF